MSSSAGHLDYAKITKKSTKELEKAITTKKGSNGYLDRKQQKQVVDALLLLDKLNLRLKDFGSEEAGGDIHRFAKAWFLYKAATEVLKYSIENDPRDLSKIGGMIDPIKQLLDQDDWLTPPLEAFFRELYVLPDKNRIKTVLYTLSLDVPGIEEEVKIPGRIPVLGQPEIPVSSEHFPFAPILEEGIASHVFAPAIIDAYALKLQKLIERDGITHLCFIEKSVGPIGALGLLSSLTERVKKPSFVYRTGHWPEVSRLSASIPWSSNGRPLAHPNVNSRVALVYDLLVTGGALREAADELKRFRTHVTSAVVLFGYNKDLHEKNGFHIRCAHGKVSVDAIGWYEDFSSEIQQIYEGKVKATEHLVPYHSNTNGGSDSPVETGESGASPPESGGSTMKTRFHEPRIWKSRLGSYRDKRALKFETRDELSRAFSMFWDEDNILYGLPRDHVGDNTIIVPAEAVSYFEEEGLRFQESRVRSVSELSLEKRRQLRRQQGTY